MIEKPETGGEQHGSRVADTVSDVLAGVRLSAALQFCFVPAGDWQTDAAESMAQLAGARAGLMPFHIVVEGDCWVQFEGATEALEAGDVVVFPFGDPHVLGAGRGGRAVAPISELPPPPWPRLPVMRYADGEAAPVRILCGFLDIGAMDFAPLRQAMPRLMLIRTRDVNDAGWIQSMIRQMVAEVDAPRPGGPAMLARQTELLFIELLRLRILGAEPDSTGWLAALADPGLGRAIGLIHANPARDWTVAALAEQAGLSRSALTARFQALLETSPMRYVRDWRLYLASVDLGTGNRAVAAIAHEAGYGTEAAFNRAFSRLYEIPPAAWRRRTRASAGQMAD